jgi:hypothetical protein
MKLTLSTFLLNEDLSTEIAMLQSQITQLNNRKAKQDKLIDDQVRRLQQNLFLKQKQAENLAKSNNMRMQQQQPANQPTPQQNQPVVGNNSAV